MTDIENEILTSVRTALSDTSTVYAIGENTGNKYPITIMREIDNSVYSASSDSDSIENHTSWGCQFDTYTNIKAGKKAQNKAIMNTIDATMADMGFKRIMYEQMENVKDNTICRYVSRYTGIVSTSKTVFRG